jgi:citrate synthase
MKFGHRVYAAEDPRATYLRVTSAGLAGTRGDNTRFMMSRQTEGVADADRDSQSRLGCRPAPAIPFVVAR